MPRNTEICLFLKQCLVTLGSALAVANAGFYTAITSVVTSQLKESNFIKLTDIQASWWVSAGGITSPLGVILGSITMTYFGRKKSLIISVASATAAWIAKYFAASFTTLIFVRLLHGLDIGINILVTAMYIGECSSPQYRGFFLATSTSFFYIAVLTSHTLGINLGWQKSALVFAGINFLNLLIILCCPESPSILAVHGKYDECKRTFRWLRGNEEEKELEKIITNVLVKIGRTNTVKTTKFPQRIKEKFDNAKRTVMKKEFYKPILITQVLCAMGEWSGGNLMDHFSIDIATIIVGPSANIPNIIYSIDIQKIVTTLLTTFVYRTVKRRHMLLTIVPLNIVVYFVIAGYTYAKSNFLLNWDHPLIGTLLMHVHMFSYVIGSNALQNVMIGELLPLEFKYISGMLCCLFFAINYFVNMKTAHYLFSALGFHGTYCLYASIVLLCYIIELYYLPETKGRTLVDIEKEFESNRSLKSMPAVELDDLVQVKKGDS